MFEVRHRRRPPTSDSTVSLADSVAPKEKAIAAGNETSLSSTLSNGSMEKLYTESNQYTCRDQKEVTAIISPSVTDKEDRLVKFKDEPEETLLEFALEVSFPFLAAGLGMVAAGFVLNSVKVSIGKLLIFKY